MQRGVDVHQNVFIELVTLFNDISDRRLVSKHASFVLSQVIFNLIAYANFLNQCFSTGGTRPTADT